MSHALFARLADATLRSGSDYSLPPLRHPVGFRISRQSQMHSEPSLHVGFDLLFLLPGESGGRETYARELMRALRRSARPLTVTAFVNARTAEAGRGFWTEWADQTVRVRGANPTSRACWVAGENGPLPRAAEHASIDVLHSPANVAPLRGRFARVLTLHDALFTRRTTRVIVRRAARAANSLIAVSEAARDELISVFGLAADTIHVIPHGLPELGPAADATPLRAMLALDPRPAVLAVSADLPHKNLDGALAGLAALRPEERPVLVCAGRGTDGSRLRARAQSLGVDDDVRFLGVVDPAELEALYSISQAMIAPALGEGFGLTVLEAMARRVAVAASDVPAHREVAGDCAIWFDPVDPTSVAAALRAALNVAATTRIREAGAARAATFTWDAAAASTLEVYDQAFTDQRLSSV